MATFNVDSLDFKDDESVEFGASPDFDMRFDSANARLELEDRVNTAVGYVPQSRGGDLVDGRFAETVAEGKALADDGNTYDSVQAAVDAASSWVKVGPGTFDDAITVSTTALTVAGSGRQTKFVNTDSITIDAKDVTLHNFSVIDSFSHGVRPTSNGDAATIDHLYVRNSVESGITSFDGNIHRSDWVIQNCRVEDSGQKGIAGNSVRGITVNNLIVNTAEQGIVVRGDSVVVGNMVKDSDVPGIEFRASDALVGVNRIHNCDKGIYVQNNDNIVFNNRISDSDVTGIDDNGTNTILDGNLTGGAN